MLGKPDSYIFHRHANPCTAFAKSEIKEKGGKVTEPRRAVSSLHFPSVCFFSRSLLNTCAVKGEKTC